MSAPQTSILATMPIGTPGQWADLQSDEFGVTESRINTEASASLVFGTLQQVDSSNKETGAKQVGATSDVIAGILLFERVYDFPSERDDFGPLPGLPVELARKGRMIVFSETAVTAETSEVHVRIGGEDRSTDKFLGGWRATGSTGVTMKLDPKSARWKTTTSGAGPAVLEFDFPPGTLSTPSAD